jgi:competence protein ComEA
MTPGDAACLHARSRRRRTLAAATLTISLALVAGVAAALELNTATRAELEQLNGIGVAMADRILDERARRPFRDWMDLEARVKGMHGARSERLRANGVTINGRARPAIEHPASVDPMRSKERVR